MAYVMNPFSYKLGYSLPWTDNWFSNKKLYPEILQIIMTIRYFLIFFWTKRNIEILDTYLSHLSLTIHSGRLFITLFFYEAKINNYPKYKFKILHVIMNSIPYSKPTKEFFFKKRYNIGATIQLRAKSYQHREILTHFYNPYSSPLQSLESQRFFLFFSFLGLHTDYMFLEFFLRYGENFKANLEFKKMLMVSKDRKKKKKN